VLARIEIELGHQNLGANGHLIVTFNDFEHYGVRRDAIAPSLRVLEALGFIKTELRGRGGGGGMGGDGIPSRYRLTFRPTERDRETNNWRNIETRKEAREIAKKARGAKSENLRTQSSKPDRQGGCSVLKSGPIPVRESGTTEAGRKRGLLSRPSAPCTSAVPITSVRSGQPMSTRQGSILLNVTTRRRPAPVTKPCDLPRSANGTASTSG
jgi:hypothetical protein